MKIAIAGGLGFEMELLEMLQGHKILLVGSGYDLKKEKFPVYNNVEFIGEFLTRGYEAYFADYDIFIDVSESQKSKFILNDLALKFHKKYIALFYDRTWKVALLLPDTCLECLLPYRSMGPYFLIPAVPLPSVLSKIKKAVDTEEGGSYYSDLPDGANIKIPLSDSCIASGGNLRFLGGEMDDVVAVSCSDQSVAVTPMEEIILDLDFYRQILAKETKIIGQNTFYLEFRIYHFNALLFRHGRLIVKGTKEKNTALAVYRRYIGN